MTFSALHPGLLHFLLADSAHVSLSWALPRAFAFWAILFLVALVGTDSQKTHPASPTRASQEFPRSEEPCVAALGLHFTPGYFLSENASGYNTPRLLQADESKRLPFTVPILGQAHYSASKGLRPLTALPTCISCVAIAAS